MKPLIIFLVVVTVGLLGSPHNPSPQASSQNRPAQPTQTAEQKFKNIQIFKGMPAAQLDPTMAFISGSLGVKCNYCHVNQFEKDDKPTKLTARRMIQMVFDLNKGSLAGQGAVSCYTCHRGKPLPVSVPVVGQNLWQPNPAGTNKQESPLPTVDQVLDRYVQALGGAQALEKITSRVAKGWRIGADGVLVPEEVYQKAPNKLLTITTYPNIAFSVAFNGTAGWGISSKGEVEVPPDELLAQLKRESVFYQEIKTKELYTKLTITGKTTIGDSEAYVIEGTPLNGSPEKLYFDARTGLLVRRYLELATVLGKLPLQTDYEDYREVNGVTQPFLIHWSMPGRIWGRKIAEIRQNVPLDDAQFNPPSARP